jgi:hypothetical protein
MIPAGGLSIPEAPAMTLDQWLSTPRLLPAADFARLCGASPAAVSRWRRGQIPAPEHMRQVWRVTRGAVRPSDFYGLPELEVAAKRMKTYGKAVNKTAIFMRLDTSSKPLKCPVKAW